MTYTPESLRDYTTEELLDLWDAGGVEDDAYLSRDAINRELARRWELRQPGPRYDDR